MMQKWARRIQNNNIEIQEALREHSILVPSTIFYRYILCLWIFLQVTKESSVQLRLMSVKFHRVTMEQTVLI